MFKLKYIVYLVGKIEHFVIFPSLVNHSDMARQMKITLDVVSAGFIKVEENGMRCYGDSFSLDKKSRPIEDTHLVNRFIEND